MSHTPNQSPARARICGLIKPAILVEESIVPKENLNYDLLDYKFFCFNGKVKVFKIDRGRSKGKHSANYYSKEGEIIPIVEDCCPTKFDYVDEMPANLNEMIDIAEKLAQFVHRAFIRVDLYNVEGKIYFGELTFYPAAGYGSFTPQEWDFELGEWIDLHKQW